MEEYLKDYEKRIINKKIIQARDADYCDIPINMDDKIKEYLLNKKIEKLYSHQVEMFNRAINGENLVITTSTASGKTLSFVLPIIQKILKNPSTRAIFIYPTKALASDQYRTMESFVKFFGDDNIQIGIYDGDTPPNERSRIRNTANIILTNPDMLNTAFLPNHSKYGFDFIFANLKYVVIDEMHTYRGAFGTHFSNVINRLKRVAKYYNSKIQFMASSATIANPIELAENLCAETFGLVNRDGSPSSRKNIYIWQPPFIKSKGYKMPIVQEASNLIPDIVINKNNFISFCKSRKAVEIILKEVRDKLKNEINDNFSKLNLVAGYRGGYKSTERKEIERKMISGELKGLISTNALELGIDIGSVNTVVVVGFPGTKASFWQQSGRAGRQKEESTTILILDEKALDQYIAANSEWLFCGEVENAILDRKNLYIQIAHIRAAAAELPLSLDDISLFPDLGEVIPVLIQAKELTSKSGKYIWNGEGFPAGDFSLRNIDNTRYRVINLENKMMITEMDEMQTYLELYKGAIYMHDGIQYLVVDQNIKDREIKVKPTDVNYFTEAIKGTELKMIKDQMKKELAKTQVFLGDVNVNYIVSYYRVVQFHNHIQLETQKFEEPLSKDFDTEGLCFTIPVQVYDLYHKLSPIEPLEVRSRRYWTYFDSISFVLLNSEMRRTMGTKSDIDCGILNINLYDEIIHSICLYDLYPGGLGFANKAYDLAKEILEDSIAMIKGCNCKRGCAACIGDYTLDKKVVLWGLESMLKDVEVPKNIKRVDEVAINEVEKSYKLFELEKKWLEFRDFIKGTGEYLTEFLADVNKVIVKDNILKLYVTNNFYRDWLREEINNKQLTNIIAEYVEVPRDFVIEVECYENNTVDKTDNIIKKYNDLLK